MIRMVLLTCAMQVCGLGISHAQTRDQIIVLAMLGQVPGDKAEAAGPSKVVASKRVDDQTINIEIKAGSDHKTIQIKEDPECVFSIGSNATLLQPKSISQGIPEYLRMTPLFGLREKTCHAATSKEQRQG